MCVCVCERVAGTAPLHACHMWLVLGKDRDACSYIAEPPVDSLSRLSGVMARTRTTWRDEEMKWMKTCRHCSCPGYQLSKEDFYPGLQLLHVATYGIITPSVPDSQ